MQIILIVAASILGWIGCALANIRLYRATFNSDGYGDRDLIVLLGPIGSLMLGLCAGLMGYTKLCSWLGQRWSKASTFALLFAVFIPWVGSGAANYVWNNRLFKTNNEDDMARDFIVALGPVGSFMLFLCWIVSIVCNIRDTTEGAKTV